MPIGDVMRYLTSLALIGAVGCAGDPTADSNADPSTNESEGLQLHSEGTKLLAVASRGGRTLEFRGGEAGDIIEIEYGELGEVELLPDSTDRYDFVARYELLSGSVAPPALREAQARAAHLRGETDDGPRISPAQPRNAIEKDVGRAWPRPLSRGTFRNSYCAPVDRTYFELDVHQMRQLHWSGVNYWKAGVYNGAANETVDVGLEYRWSFGSETMRRTLPPGHYMALRVSTSADASAFVGVDTFESFMDYDICVNYHF